MTSKEHLHEYRQSTEGKPAHERVYFFHAHIYYDASIPEEKEKMLKLQQRLQQDFSGDKHVSVHARQEGPVGPHVKANLEVLFTRERFAHMICYLTFVAPKTFSTLVHELTADTKKLRLQVGDHTTRAIWLGKQLDVKTELLEKMDKKSAETGKTEEEIIWAVHHHGIDHSK